MAYEDEFFDGLEGWLEGIDFVYKACKRVPAS